MLLVSGETYLVAVGAESEVLDSLSSVLGSTEKKGIRSGRGTQGQLIQSQSLTTGLLDSGSGSSRKTKSGD